MFPASQDRLEAPSNGALKHYIEIEQQKRLRSVVGVTSLVYCLAFYLVCLMSRVLTWPIFGNKSDTHWFFVMISEWISWAYYPAQLCILCSIVSFCYFFWLFAQVTSNPKAAEPLGHALLHHLTSKSLMGLAAVVNGTICFFVTSSIAGNPGTLSFDFLRHGTESCFVLGFLLLNGLKFFWSSLFENTLVLKFTIPVMDDPTIPLAGKLWRRFKLLFLSLDFRRLVRETARQLWLYTVIVALFYSISCIATDDFNIGDVLSYYSARALFRSFFFSLVLTFLRTGLFNVYNVLFTAILDLNIADAEAGVDQLLLHQTLHPSLKQTSVWVRHLGFTDLRRSSQYSTERRAMIFDPGMNCQTFDRLCQTLLANVDQESAKWESIKEAHEKQFQTQPMKMVARSKTSLAHGPFTPVASPIEPFVVSDAPEGLRPRFGQSEVPGVPTQPTSPMAASTPVKYFGAPSPARLMVAKGPKKPEKRSYAADLFMKKGGQRVLTAFEGVIRWIATRGIVVSMTEVPEDARAIMWRIDAVPIIWAVESFGLLVAASVTEDRKGIIVYHLARILAALFRLRKALLDASAIANASIRQLRLPGQASPEAKLRTDMINSVNESLGTIAKHFASDLKTMRLTEEQLIIMENCRKQLKANL